MDTEKKPVTILIVDDEPDILEFLGYNLKKEGFTVLVADNGKKAIKLAKEHTPDIIVLDLMMPDMDGIETCHELRSINTLDETRIVFLTARNEDYTQIAGLEAGADDFISKPVKPKVLITRLKVLMRRARKSQAEQEDKIEYGEFSIDRSKFLVTVNETQIQLPKKEFELLWLLASKPGTVFSRDIILNNVWGGEVLVGDRTVDVHISKVREKIGEHYIKTVKSVGYSFVI
jgi:two-component system, OmpR family, alkaline phosphatase synthesis response regulator PhoP